MVLPIVFVLVAISHLGFALPTQVRFISYSPDAGPAKATLSDGQSVNINFGIQTELDVEPGLYNLTITFSNSPKSLSRPLVVVPCYIPTAAFHQTVNLINEFAVVEVQINNDFVETFFSELKVGHYSTSLGPANFTIRPVSFQLQFRDVTSYFFPITPGVGGSVVVDFVDPSVPTITRTFSSSTLSANRFYELALFDNGKKEPELRFLDKGSILIPPPPPPSMSLPQTPNHTITSQALSGAVRADNKGIRLGNALGAIATFAIVGSPGVVLLPSTTSKYLPVATGGAFVDVTVNGRKFERCWYQSPYSTQDTIWVVGVYSGNKLVDVDIKSTTDVPGASEPGAGRSYLRLGHLFPEAPEAVTITINGQMKAGFFNYGDISNYYAYVSPGLSCDVAVMNINRTTIAELKVPGENLKANMLYTVTVMKTGLSNAPKIVVTEDGPYSPY
eukprot:m.147512 g.147512  ORF g.147512 m.147512 type:complete len:446 (-) comp16262_c0_seq2:2694-4031(-)